MADDPGARGVKQRLPGVGQRVDQPALDGLRGGHQLAVLQIRLARGQAGQAGHAHHAAGARHQAQRGFGQAELDLGLVQRDAMVAGQRDLEAAAQRGAIERGHDRLAQRFEPAQGVLAELGGFEQPLRIGGLHPVEAVQVAAGEEGLLGGRQDDAGDVGFLGFEAGHHVGKALPHGVGHGVDALFRRVEGEGDDAVGGLVVLDRGLHLGVSGRAGWSGCTRCSGYFGGGLRGVR
ncbi:hypothetical protein D3C81_672150 [compost metagenome]